MYKLFKEKGYTDITLKNMETSAEISLGRYSLSIKTVLEDDGYYIDNPDITGDKSILSTDKWSLNISDDMAKDLNSLAFRGTRPPVRRQTAKPKEETKVKAGAKIDLFDLIFNDD